MNRQVALVARRPLTPPNGSTLDATVKIASGVRLGAFEILEPVGSGGMGEVYRAQDTRLNRPVAMKFLSAEIAAAATARRFQQGTNPSSYAFANAAPQRNLFRVPVR